METLPSFQSLLDSTTTTTAVETNASSHHPVGHYPLADVGSSPFFSSSSSFFSSSSSFFSSSGELSGLLASSSSSSSSSSSRRGRESPVSPSSPPCQTGPSNAPLASFLGSFTMSTTTTTHTTTAPPSAFKPVGHGLAPAPCTLPLGQALLPGPSSVTATSAASAMLPFHASAHSHALSQSVLPLTSDARAIKKKDCGAHTATAVHAAAGSSGKPGVRVCTMCGTSKTKQWRSGSDGKPSLCNACGLRYRKDSLGQKFKFKQVIIFPSGTTRASGSNNNKKRKALATSDDKNKADSVDEKELTASLAAAKSASKKRRHASPAAAAADQHDTRSREISPDRRSDIYSLLN